MVGVPRRVVPQPGKLVLDEPRGVTNNPLPRRRGAKKVRKANLERDEGAAQAVGPWVERGFQLPSKDLQAVIRNRELPSALRLLGPDRLA